MRRIDLTHTITDNMPVFPGDLPVSLKQTVFIEEEGNNDHTLTSAMHVGTHLDAPLHMIAGGKRVDELSVEQFFGKGILIDARGKQTIDSALVENVTIPKNASVLIYTGFGEKFYEATYFESSPEITQDFAEKMVEAKVRMVGMDTSSPEHNPPWTIHKTLLKHNILILENLTNLDKLVGIASFDVIALPSKVRADAAPVRVIATVSE